MTERGAGILRLLRLLRVRGGLALVCLLVAATQTRADDARPLSLAVREVGNGRFHVRFQTPMRGRARLRVSPRLPAGAALLPQTLERRIAGDSLIEEFEFELEGGLVGRSIGIDGLGLIARNALLTVRLHDGRVLRAVLGGRRLTYEIEPVVTPARALWTNELARETRRGFTHAIQAPAHLLLVLALVLAAGSSAGWFAALGLFLLSSVLGSLVGPLDGITPELADALVALAAGLAGREALLGRRRGLLLLAGLAGLLHGLAHGSLPFAFGVDLAHLLIGTGAALGLAALPFVRRGLSWTAGVLAFAFAVILVLTPDPVVAEAKRSAIPMPMAVDQAAARATPVQGLVTDVEAYLDVGVFETRLEVLGRLGTLASWLGVDVPLEETLDVDVQAALLGRLADALPASVEIELDGRRPDAARVRKGFATQEATGTYLRDVPAPEPTASALVGLMFSFDAPEIPDRVEVRWLGFPPGLTRMRTRVIDPEISREVMLLPASPTLVWTNELTEAALPPVRSIDVRRAPFPVPVATLVLVLIAVVAGSVLFVRHRRAAAFALLRVAAPLAFLVAPTLTLDASAWVATEPVRSEQEARAITQALLENVYRAFNAREESRVYDRLALSLAEGTREDAYLENRRTLAFERVGGARTHVDAVELVGLDGLEPMGGGGFESTARWTVTGSVTHFGHRHLRTNLYRARLTIAPVGDAWKITDFVVEDLERQR